MRLLRRAIMSSTVATFSLLLLLHFYSLAVDAWEFELESGTNRLMARNFSLAWGTVCDDLWSAATTRALCRIANITSTPSVVSFFTAGVTPVTTIAPLTVYLANVVCPDTAAIFDSQCQFSASSSNSLCSLAENIGIFCFPWIVQRESATQVVRLKPGLRADPAQTSFGTLCAPGGLLPSRDTAANLCKIIIQQTVAASVAKTFLVDEFAPSRAGIAGSAIYAAGINCPVSAVTFEDCSWTYVPAAIDSGCSRHTNVGLTCSPQPLFPHPTASWILDIPSPTAGNLAGATVRVRPNSSAPWGSICTDDIDKSTALAICKMWGRTFQRPPLPEASINALAASWTTSAVARTNGAVIPSTPPLIYLDQLNCKATDTSISSCSYIYSDVGQRRDDCGADEQLVLFCDQWSLRVEKDTLRLLVRPSPNEPEGTVCGTGFTTNEARVFCRMLGHEDRADMSFFYVGDTNRSNSNSPIYLSGVGCTADARNLQECVYRRYPDVQSGCSTRLQTIALDCNGTRTTAAPERRGMLTSEIILAVMVPLVIVIFVCIYYVVKRLTDTQEELMRDQSMQDVGRSPSSQALTNFTSVIASPSKSAKGGRGSAPPLTLDAADAPTFGLPSPRTASSPRNSVADILHKKSSTTAQTAAAALSHPAGSERRRGGGNTKSPDRSRPNFSEYSRGGGADEGGGSRDNTPRRFSTASGVAPRLAPLAGAAAVSNPFGRASPHARKTTPSRHATPGGLDFSDL